MESHAFAVLLRLSDGRCFHTIDDVELFVVNQIDHRFVLEFIFVRIAEKLYNGANDSFILIEYANSAPCMNVSNYRGILPLKKL